MQKGENEVLQSSSTLTTSKHTCDALQPRNILGDLGCSHLSSYLKSVSITAGFSRYDFHRFENLHMVAPSMTRWSADQLTYITCALYTLSFSSNLGRTCNNITCYEDNYCIFAYKAPNAPTTILSSIKS